VAQRDLKVTLVGDDRTGKAFASGESGAKKFGKAIAGISVAVGAAALAVGGALYKIGSDFDDAYDTIRVGTGATGDALASLQDDFKAVVQDVPTDFGTASAAIADLNTRTGLTGEPLQKLSKQMLEVSRITKTDVATNIAGVTRAFGDWSIATDKQSDAADFLFKVSQTTGIGMDALSDKVVQFGAPMRQFGFSFEESAALMGKWEKEGVNTEAIMGGLRSGLGKLAKAGKDPAKAFQEIQASIKGAGSTGEATAIAIEAFGQRAGPDLAAAVREGRFQIDDLVSTLGASGETIMGAGAETQDFAEKWQMFKNRILVKLEPIATRVFNALGDGMDKLSAWWDSNGDAVLTGFRDVKDTVAAFGDKVAEVTDWVKRNWDTIKTVTLTAAAIMTPILLRLAGQWAFVGTKAKASALSQVIAWLTAQGAAIKGAAVFMVQTYRVIGGWALMSAKALFHGLKVAAVWTAQVAASAVSGAAAFGVQVLRVVGGWALMGAKALLHAAKMAAAWVIAMGPVGWVIAAVVGLVALVIANWDKIKRYTAAAWKWVSDKVSGAWRWIKDSVSNGISNVVSFAKGLPGRILGALGNLGSLLLGAGKDLIRGFINGVKNMFGSVKDTLGNLTSKLTSWKGPPSTDRTLLKGAGQMLIEGFIGGMESQYGGVRSSLQGLTSDVAKMAPVLPADMLRVADTQALGRLTGMAAGVGGVGGAGRATAPGTAGATPARAAVHIENYNEARRSPHEVAADLTFMARTGG
jgi:TP901 family phage tail tape measure protein